MMSRSRDAARGASRPIPRVIAGSLFAGTIVLIAAVAAWPIYRSVNFSILVVVSTIVAATIATIAWRRTWSGWLVAGALAVAFFVVGVPLAVPSRLGNVTEVASGLGELASGFVFAWKDLVTAPLPAGSYRNLLVPALVIFLIGTTMLLLLAWRGDHLAYLAAPIAIAMTSFGLFFGRTAVSAPLALGPLTLYAPVETALGVGTLVVCVTWLAWRTGDERVAALQRAAVSSGVRYSARPSRADRHRIGLGAGMVSLAVVVAVVVVPFIARDADRDVLRSVVGPDIDLAAEVSPLSKYRALFADANAQEVIFTVDGEGALPSRVRIATLDSYDGEVFRSGGTGSAESGRFVRVPSMLDAGEGEAVTAEITIEQLSGIWMPTFGNLEAVDFGGSRGATLADQFYYNAAAAAGVQIAGGGLGAGDTYVVQAVEPSLPALVDIEPTGGRAADVAAPESLELWVKEHAVGSGGVALDGLVSLLRERGYLSHGLTGADAEQPLWATALANYSIQPSASGHSLARIDSLFQRLLERESDPRAQQSDNYVAGIGDDEQFAVSVALIARELGFDSRVVLGTRMDAAPAGLAACENGVCEAQDVTVWTEVAAASGQWVPIDVTPQYAKSPSLDVTELRDPKNVTEVRPDSAEPVLPPDPVQQDSAAPDNDDDAGGVDLAWLWPVLRVSAIVLLLSLIAFGPFLMIIAAKAMRRRGRRSTGTAAERIAGAWDEYLDAAVDAGLDAPPTYTRRELATQFATPGGGTIADAADHAVFSGEAIGESDVNWVWVSVDEERRGLRDGKKVFTRLAATVSLRSFIRQLAPNRGTSSQIVQKGRGAKRSTL
ncbi:transglutaminase-like domain-containing protein (plasmid) [Coraliomargarita sp. W4R53]